MSEFKVGNKVWAKATIKHIDGESLRLTFYDDWTLWLLASDCRPVEPVNSPKILDSSIEPMRDAFEDWIAPKYDWDQSYFSRNENRYFDSEVELIWQAYQSGVSYQPIPLPPSPCMDGVNVDDFVDGIMEARGKTEGFQVGDAVRIKHDKDERLPLVIRSLQSSGSDNTPIALCVSECGKRVRWSAFEEMERIDQADPINPSHYKHLPAEAIDIIMAAIAKAPSNESAFLQGQVIKYLLRCWSKKGIEDLRKAKWYLDRLVGGFDDLLSEASGANDGRNEVGE